MMEEGLLPREEEEEEEERSGPSGWGREVAEEGKRLGYLAAPMVVVMLLQYMVRQISMMMVGRLGELALSSASMAISLTGVTGFSLIAGMAGALETFCGQAYGARQYRKLGTHMYRAVMCIVLVCIPISLLWFNMGKLMVLMKQDPVISQQAEVYSTWLIPALFGYAFLVPLMKFLQTQGLILPMLYAAALTLVLFFPICWLLVFHFGMGNAGAALANGLAYWINLSILLLYVMLSDSCKSTRSMPSMEAFQGISDFLRLAFSSSVMICLEWWSYELLVLLSGLMPNPQLETSVLSICLNSQITLYSIPFGLGVAASTRVSNELGAGNARGARSAVRAAMLAATLEGLILSLMVFLLRKSYGYIYSNELEVVTYVNKMVPLVSISILMDNIQTVLSGIARGCGWQLLGAYINVGAFYVIGIPVAIVLGFLANLRGEGLWIGILCGCIAQTFLLILIASFVDWEEQARIARERTFGEKRIDADMLK